MKSVVTLSLDNVMTSKAQVRCKSIEATLLYQICLFLSIYYDFWPKKWVKILNVWSFWLKFDDVTVTLFLTVLSRNFFNKLILILSWKFLLTFWSSLSIFQQRRHHSKSCSTKCHNDLALGKTQKSNFQCITSNGRHGGGRGVGSGHYRLKNGFFLLIIIEAPISIKNCTDILGSALSL